MEVQTGVSTEGHCQAYYDGSTVYNPHSPTTKSPPLAKEPPWTLSFRLLLLVSVVFILVVSIAALSIPQIIMLRAAVSEKQDELSRRTIEHAAAKVANYFEPVALKGTEVQLKVTDQYGPGEWNQTRMEVDHGRDAFFAVSSVPSFHSWSMVAHNRTVQSNSGHCDTDVFVVAPDHVIFTSHQTQQLKWQWVSGLLKVADPLVRGEVWSQTSCKRFSWDGWAKRASNRDKAVTNKGMLWGKPYNVHGGAIYQSLTFPILEKGKSASAAEVLGFMLFDVAIIARRGSYENYLSHKLTEVVPKHHNVLYAVKDGVLLATSHGKAQEEILDSSGEVYLREFVSATNATIPDERVYNSATFMTEKYGTNMKNWPQKVETDRFIIHTGFLTDDYNLDIHLVLVTEKQSVFSTVDQLVQILVLTCCAGILPLMLLGALLLAAWVTSPLKDAANTIQRLTRLDMAGAKEKLAIPGKLAVSEVANIQASLGGLHQGLQSLVKYVPISVVDHIINSPMQEVSTPSLSEGEATVVFQDLVGFTELSEKFGAADLVALVSPYMDTMSSIMTKHGGTIDKYIGDCIMVVFNEPHSVCHHHANAACQAAVECYNTLPNINADNTSKGLPELDFRIGIHTGDVLVGNFGSTSRLNYTVVGDTVNIAAKLEPLNKRFGTMMLISQDVKNEAPSQITRKLRTVKLVGGKEESTTVIYELLACKEDYEKLNPYEDALREFERREFVSCANLLDSLLGFDLPSNLLHDTALHFISHPPARDWSHVDKIINM